MITIDSHLARVDLPGGIALNVREVKATLDDSWAPYAQVDITIPKPSLATLNRLDPRQSPAPRVRLELSQVFGDSDPVSAMSADWVGLKLSNLSTRFAGKAVRDISAGYYRPWNTFGARNATRRAFDLAVRARPIDHNDGTLTLTLASDEALLQDYALVATAPYAPGNTSVRTIVSYVLSLIGGVLQPGTADGVVNADASTWTPGDTAWQYVTPLVEQAGLRLWCDEQRRWYLQVSGTAAPGQLTLAVARTVTQATDDITRDGDWYDAVVVVYTWTDAANVQRTQYDVASVPGFSKVKTLTRENTPYPGPGAAQQVLNRRIGVGRQQTVSAVSDYTATPTQALSLALPDADTQTGFLSAVTWRLPAAEMDVKSRGLVNTPPTAYLFGPAGKKYVQVPAGIKYTAFDWSTV